MNALEAVRADLKAAREEVAKLEKAEAALSGSAGAAAAKPPGKSKSKVQKKATKDGMQKLAKFAKRNSENSKARGGKKHTKRVELEPVNAQTRKMVLDELEAAKQQGGLAVNAEGIRFNCQASSGRHVKSLANVFAALKRDGQVIATGNGRGVTYSLPETAEETVDISGETSEE